MNNKIKADIHKYAYIGDVDNFIKVYNEDNLKLLNYARFSFISDIIDIAMLKNNTNIVKYLLLVSKEDEYILYYATKYADVELLKECFKVLKIDNDKYSGYAFYKGNKEIIKMFTTFNPIQALYNACIGNQVELVKLLCKKCIIKDTRNILFSYIKFSNEIYNILTDKGLIESKNDIFYIDNPEMVDKLIPNKSNKNSVGSNTLYNYNCFVLRNTLYNCDYKDEYLEIFSDLIDKQLKVVYKYLDKGYKISKHQRHIYSIKFMVRRMIYNGYNIYVDEYESKCVNEYKDEKKMIFESIPIHIKDIKNIIINYHI
jgi:hypothetical protein